MLPLILVPNNILRSKTEPVALPPTAELVTLAREMIVAMKHYNGIGLAAPQIDKSLKLIVVATASAPSVYLNPEIIRSSWKKVEMEEGCLSIPGVFGLVKRPAKVLARYYTLTGELKEEWLSDMVARIYQHEVDHTNGILFTDKVSKITSGQELLAKYGLD